MSKECPISKIFFCNLLRSEISSRKERIKGLKKEIKFIKELLAKNIEEYMKEEV